MKEKGLVKPRFVLAGPGDLTDEFLRVGPVFTYERSRHKQLGTDSIVRILRSFCGRDLSLAYLNTVAAGDVIEVTRRLDVPQIAHVHELEKSIQRFAGPEKMSPLVAHTDMFIAASGPVADNLHERHGISRQRLRVVDSFITCTGVRSVSDSEKRACKSALGLNPDAYLVLGCGTTDWRKGPDIFIEVAGALRKIDPQEVQFVWVGSETQPGEVSELERLAHSRGVRKDVRFIGEISTPLQFMLASDIFLLPSREDPFPLVCLESADCGVPIVCFADAGGMPGFVAARCGVVVPHLDVEAMAGELHSLLRDETRRRQLGEQAREKVRRELDVSVKGQEIYEILREVIRTPGRAALRAGQA
jgi:glycosyltransferase involved in cell wall biosynthesis